MVWNCKPDDGGGDDDDDEEEECDDDNGSDDGDIYIMMKCLSVCHEKWSLPLKVCDFLSENVWVKICFFVNFFLWIFF